VEEESVVQASSARRRLGETARYVVSVATEIVHTLARAPKKQEAASQEEEEDGKDEWGATHHPPGGVHRVWRCDTRRPLLRCGLQSREHSTVEDEALQDHRRSPAWTQRRRRRSSHTKCVVTGKNQKLVVAAGRPV